MNILAKLALFSLLNVLIVVNTAHAGTINPSDATVQYSDTFNYTYPKHVDNFTHESTNSSLSGDNALVYNYTKYDKILAGQTDPTKGQTSEQYYVIDYNLDNIIKSNQMITSLNTYLQAIDPPSYSGLAANSTSPVSLSLYYSLGNLINKSTLAKNSSTNLFDPANLTLVNTLSPLATSTTNDLITWNLSNDWSQIVNLANSDNKKNISFVIEDNTTNSSVAFDSLNSANAPTLTTSNISGTTIPVPEPSSLLWVCLVLIFGMLNFKKNKAIIHN